MNSIQIFLQTDHSLFIEQRLGSRQRLADLLQEEISPGQAKQRGIALLFCYIHTDIHPSLIGEDMYYYGTRIPILYFHLGSESQHPLHSNQYLPKEACIETGSLKPVKDTLLASVRRPPMML